MWKLKLQASWPQKRSWGISLLGRIIPAACQLPNCKQRVSHLVSPTRNAILLIDKTSHSVRLPNITSSLAYSTDLKTFATLWTCQLLNHQSLGFSSEKQADALLGYLGFSTIRSIGHSAPCLEECKSPLNGSCSSERRATLLIFETLSGHLYNTF